MTILGSLAGLLLVVYIIVNLVRSRMEPGAANLGTVSQRWLLVHRSEDQ